MKVVLVGAGDGRRLVDGQGEGLGGVGDHAVGGGDGERVGAAGAGGGRAGQRGGAVAVVDEASRRGAGPRSRSGPAVGKPVVVTVNVPGVPAVNVVLVGAGDRRRLVDGQGEGLGGVGTHAVGGGDGERVGAAGAGGGVPARVAVPLPLSTKVTPRAVRPVSVRAAVGKPVVVTVKVPACPR